MLMLGVAGIMTSMAFAGSIRMGMVSEAGKAIAVAVAAIGIALGMTVGTIAAGVGAGAVTRVSVALIGGAVFVIAVNAAARRRIGKASAR